MPPLSVMIKPASSDCNLDCEYCFYKSLSEKRKLKSYGQMDLDLLEEIVKTAFATADGACNFAFQGGEPTLVGLEFYQHLLQFIRKYNTNNIKVNKSIQTNGIRINKEWAKFFADNNFLVGISLDGPQKIHDLYRVDHANRGTQQQVMEAIKLLEQAGAEYNILTVVNAEVANNPTAVYDFFKQQGFNYLQFIKCLDPVDEKPGQSSHSLLPEDYAQFLKTLFDLWYQDLKQGQMISIRYFDNLVQMAMGEQPEACDMSGTCNCQFIIEADGSVYPCDFYVTDKWKLGNIRDDDFSTLYNSQRAQEFMSETHFVAEECKSCQWFKLCRGGCRRTQESAGSDKLELDYFCPAYQDFFQSAAARILKLAQVFNAK